MDKGLQLESEENERREQLFRAKVHRIAQALRDYVASTTPRSDNWQEKGMAYRIWAFIAQQDDLSHVCNMLCCKIQGNGICEVIRLVLGRADTVTLQELLEFSPHIQGTAPHRQLYRQQGVYSCIAVDNDTRLVLNVGSSTLVYNRVSSHSSAIKKLRRSGAASKALPFHRALTDASEWDIAWRVLCVYRSETFFMWRFYTEIVLQIGRGSVTVSKKLNLPTDMVAFIARVQKDNQWITRPGVLAGGNYELPLSQKIPVSKADRERRECAQCEVTYPGGDWYFAKRPDIYPPEAVLCGNCARANREGRERDANDQRLLNERKRLLAIPHKQRVYFHNPAHTGVLMPEDKNKPWKASAGYLECAPCYRRRLKFRVNTVAGKLCVACNTPKSQQYYKGSTTAHYICQDCFFEVPGKYLTALNVTNTQDVRPMFST